jgi:hypothetical protein
MRFSRWLIAAPVVVFCLAYGGANALGAQKVRLEVALHPEQLGHPTTISFGFRIASTDPDSPVPLTNLEVLLPGEMGIAESGLGLENCRPKRLEHDGPGGCPSNSRMGTGVATAQVPIGTEQLVESAQIELFSAPVVDGHLALLVFADATSPVEAELVFPALVLPAPVPFGENIDTSVPIVPSLPYGPDVAITSFQASLGSAPGRGRFLYHSWVRGRRVSFAPRGLTLPPSCPRGGFRFEAKFKFQDQSTTTALSTVPCPLPRRSRRYG